MSLGPIHHLLEVLKSKSEIQGQPDNDLNGAEEAIIDVYCQKQIRHIKMEASAEFHECCSKEDNEKILPKRGKLALKRNKYPFGPDYLVVKTADGSICMTVPGNKLIDTDGNDVPIAHREFEIIVSFSEYFILLSTVNLIESGNCRDSLLKQLLCLEHPNIVSSENDSRNVLHSLNESQAEVVRGYLNCKHGVHVLQGPPATGKSETIAVLVEQILTEKKGKVVIAAPSNKALESIAEKLKSKGIPFKLFALEEKIKNTHLHDHVELDMKKVVKVNVVICTLSRCFKLRDKFKPHDVIIDEAGMATEAQSLIPFILCPHRVLLAGDPKQLQPLLKHSHAPEFGLNISLLERIHTYRTHNDIPIMHLTEQYRCPEVTYAFPNEKFYGNSVQSRTTPKLLAHEGLQQLDLLTLIHVGTPYVQKGTSKTNYEVVRRVAHVLIILGSRPGINVAEDVVVICHHKALQADIEKKIGKLGVPVQTVHSFQGSESKVIIWALATTDGEFVNGPNSLNVALTRAKESLIVIGNMTSRNMITLKGLLAEFFHFVKQLKKGVCYYKRYEDMLCLPVAQQILHVCALQRMLPVSYVDNLDFGSYEAVMTVKRIEYDHRSCTIPDDFEKQIQTASNSESVVKLYSSFVSKKFDLCAKQLKSCRAECPIPLEFWILCSGKNTLEEYCKLQNTLEPLQSSENYSIRDRSELRLIRLWVQYRIACIENATDSLRTLAEEFENRAGMFEEDGSIFSISSATKFYYTWGMLLMKICQPDEAIAKLRKVCDFEVNVLNFDDVYGAYCFLGERCWHEENEKEARQMFKKAIELSERHCIPRAWAYEKLAGICMDSNDYSNAVHNSRKALSIHPGNPASFRIYQEALESIKLNQK